MLHVDAYLFFPKVKDDHLALFNIVYFTTAHYKIDCMVINVIAWPSLVML
jgi:hypothetical protein